MYHVIVDIEDTFECWTDLCDFVKSLSVPDAFSAVHVMVERYEND